MLGTMKWIQVRFEFLFENETDALSHSVTFVAKNVREFMLIIWGYNNLLLLRHRLTYSTLAVMTVTSLQIDIFRVNIQNIIHWGGGVVAITRPILKNTYLRNG